MECADILPYKMLLWCFIYWLLLETWQVANHQFYEKLWVYARHTIFYCNFSVKKMCGTS